MGFDAIDRQFRQKKILLECQNCQQTDNVEMESARTHYPFDGRAGDPDDPNRPLPLCRPCAKEHHAHWDQQWAQYHSGLI